jgi:Aldehyde dehydrogenase family
MEPSSITTTTTTTITTTTPDNDIANIVARVAGKAQEWQALPLREKIQLLQQILTNAIQFEPEWNAVAFAARGINNNNNNGNTSNSDDSDDGQGCARADTMTVGPATLGAYLNGLIASLQHGSLQKNGNNNNNNNNNGMMMMMPPPPRATRIVNSNDDCDETTCTKTTRIVTVWPRTWLDKLEAVGLRGELVVTVVKDDDDDDDDSSTLSTTTNTNNNNNNNKSLQMSFEESIKNGGGVAAILGAGNVNAPIEVLCEMFLHGRVVVYKPNPVNQAQVQVLSRIFKPLVAAGYLEFVVGDDASVVVVVVVGAALVSNPLVHRIVLTGSAATLEKIKPLIHNKTRRNATTTTSICAELGGVNPWIVVPCNNELVDSWNERSIDVYARHLAFAKMTNNGHTCAAPQVVILARDWPHRPAFINRVRYWLAAYAGNAPFYPGSDQTYARFAAWPNAEIILPAACWQ